MEPVSPRAALADVAREYEQARIKERAWATALHQAIRACAAEGMPETKIAALAGVSRMTVRKALGK